MGRARKSWSEVKDAILAKGSRSPKKERDTEEADSAEEQDPPRKRRSEALTKEKPAYGATRRVSGASAKGRARKPASPASPASAGRSALGRTLTTGPWAHHDD